MFSGSTDFRSPPSDFREDRTDRIRAKTCESSRSIETKLRIWFSDKSLRRHHLSFLRSKSYNGLFLNLLNTHG